MTNFYKCGECSNIMLEMGDPAGVCQNSGMQLMGAGTTDGAAEKHVPVAFIQGDEVRIQVGEVPHPMLPEHHIEWIYVKTTFGGVFCNLAAGDEPEAIFKLSPDEVVEVYEYCNLHGLWKAKSPVLPLTFDLNEVACSPEFTAGCVNPAKD